MPLPKQIPTVEAFSAADVDEMGELERKISLLDPLVSRHKVLTERADEAAKVWPADSPVIIRGGLYELQLGPRRNERTVVEKLKVYNFLRRALGIDGLVAAVDIPLAVIDKNIPESARAGLIVTERSGYRARKLVALQAAEKAA
jgi:hypothetical protein